ncbi:hypothetical protein H9P43_009105 [Blastocladiella emersonii ATCC 22665]|nr:hypothetical protein H9P43_009105 [Blastocladiella emersonii ATCC 22665]
MTPMDVFRSILAAGSISAGLTAPGALTSYKFQHTAELRLLTDNFKTIFDALRSMVEVSIREYEDLAAQMLVLMMIALAASIFFLLLTIGVAYISVFHRYFRHQDHVLNLLRKIPKRAAADMLTSIEEEIESFREVTATSPEEEIEGDMKRRSPGTDGSSTATVPHRSRNYKVAAGVALLVIGGLLSGMFITSLQSTSLREDIHRLTLSANRRFHMTEAVMYTIEYFSPDHIISNSDCVKGVQSTLLDLFTEHSILVNDPNGLSIMIPEHTIYPRDCVKTACPGVVERPEIGFTNAIASLPLDSEMDRYIDVTTRLADSMASTLTNLTDPASPEVETWQLSMAISADLMYRIAAANDVFRGTMSGRVAYSMMSCIVMLIATVAAIVATVASFLVLGVKKLRREARSLCSVLHLLSPAALKDTPNIAKFLENGGLTLEALTSSGETL